MNDRDSNRRPKLVRVLLTAGAIVLLALLVRFFGVAGSCVSGLCRVSADDFDNRMAVLERTDPKLVLYSEGKRIATGMQTVRGIALDKDGQIYVAGDYGIRIFRADGAHSRDIRLPAEPHCVSVAPNGTVYAGMKDHVAVIDRTGKLIANWSPPGRKALITSVFATAKDVWVADAGDRAVIRCTPDGNATGVFGVKDPSKNVDGLILPSPYLEAVPAAGGSVWVSNPGRYRIELYSPDGRMKRAWGKGAFGIEGFSGCCNPTNFAIMPDGRFVTSEKGLPRVKVYRANGTFECVVAGREAFAPESAGLDLAVDARGRIFVLDPVSRSVRVFSRKGKAGR